jgi:pyruvate/2-oxoglutarate dehydrogenase complex dihydrolipoamide dehydrogenase (E3) component
VGASRNGLERSLKTLPNCKVYEGHARFVGPKEVQVGDQALKADKIFLNVGGRASVPPIRGLDQVPYLTNSSMMDVDFLPPHLVVLGGSYIGLEFAQVYRRFGSQVTIIEQAPRLIAREDEDVSHAIADILKDEGIDIHLNSKIVEVGKQGNNIAVTIEAAGTKSHVVGSHLLLATGRRPTPTISGSTRPALRPTRTGYVRSTISCAPTCPASGRSGTATGAAPSPIPPGTISRSLPPTFSTTMPGASAIASMPMRSTSIPRSGAPA